jgi:DNA-binding response OmpR family regulator
VLILESDRLIRALIKEWLHMAGYETLCAHDAAGAARLVAGYDVVLSDVPAPLKSARDTVAGLAQAALGKPVIVMSADIPTYGASASVALARDLGAVAVLVKPFSRIALLKAVRGAQQVLRVPEGSRL